MPDPGDYHGYRAATQSWQIQDLEAQVNAQVVSFFRSSKTITFTGAAGAGAVGTVPLFSVTGRVLISGAIAYCTVDLVSDGGGTLALGTAGKPMLFGIGEGIVATELDAGEVWGGSSAVPLADGIDLNYEMGISGPFLLEDDDIILTVGTADVTAGAVSFTVFWSPFESDGSIDAV